MPQISVIIPNYNHAPYLQARIDSVLNQTFQDIELIIIDDASTDASLEIINQYQGHPLLSVIIAEKTNSGSPFVQWNKGVEKAKAEWIWIAESDDTADIHFLETLYGHAHGNEDVVIAYCQSNRMNSAGTVTGNWVNWTANFSNNPFDSDFEMDGTNFINQYLLYQNTIPNASAVLFKKSAFIEVGRTDEDIKNCSDWLLWLKIATCGKIAFTGKCLNNFRYNDKSVIASAVKSKRVSFFREFDIRMRIRLSEFLSKRNPKQTQAYRTNIRLLALEIAHECRWLLEKRRYRDFTKYVFMYGRLCLTNISLSPEILVKTMRLFRK